MFDELERLREEIQLRALLDQYAGAVDPQAWQDRVIELEGAAAADLVRLHGELIAFEWIEQNTGVLPAPRVGVLRQSYRVTTAGLRALRQTREDWAEREAA